MPIMVRARVCELASMEVSRSIFAVSVPGSEQSLSTEASAFERASRQVLRAASSADSTDGPAAENCRAIAWK